MKLINGRFFTKALLPLLFIVTAILFTGITPALAVQKADTTSTAGVTFTDIPTAADSMAAASAKKNSGSNQIC